MRVEVKNFMTYAECVIEPGPKLNLVLGPNGERRTLPFMACAHRALNEADSVPWPLLLTPPCCLRRVTSRHGQELAGVRYLPGPGRLHAPAGTRRGDV